MPRCVVRPTRRGPGRRRFVSLISPLLLLPRAQEWVKAYHAAAARALGSASASSPSLPPIQPGQSILDWFDALNVGPFGFRPAKHRKFVDRLEDDKGPAPALLPFLRSVSDLRIAHRGVQAQDAAARAGEEAVMSMPGAGAKARLSLDIDTFHTSVVGAPPQGKGGAAGKLK